MPPGVAAFRVSAALALMLALGAAGCERSAAADSASPPVAPESAPGSVSAPAPAAGSASATAPVPGSAPAPGSAPGSAPASAPDEVVLLAGGDVSFGRGLGQALLRDPGYDPFAGMAALLASADLRFANLESQLSDQRGETESPREPLVFTGPPAGAGALARARIDLVSIANNHAWDYGYRAFLETLGNLERAGVKWVGGGRSLKEVNAPALLERNGLRIAVVAVTDVWNDGSLWTHPARMHVAAAHPDLLAHVVRRARKRPDVDMVLVSYHGGAEYTPAPLPRTRLIAKRAIDAGADAFLGHHPHVIQGIEWRRGRPIFYSLGNLVMRPNPKKPDTRFGLLARLRLRRGEAPGVEVCPVRGDVLGATALPADPERARTEAEVRRRLQEVLGKAAGAVGEFSEDGCAPVRGR